MNAEYNPVRILRQLVFSYVINVVVFLIAPLGMVVLSRGLSVADFGVYSIFFILWNIGLQAFPFGFQLFIQNFLPGRAVSEQHNVVSSLFKLLAVVWFVIFSFSILLIARYDVLTLFNLHGRYLETFLVFLAIFISMLAIIPHNWIAARHELEFANILYGINSTVWILLAFSEFFLTNGLVLWHIIVYWIIGSSLQFLLNLWKLGKESKFLILPISLFDRNIVWRAILFSVPLIPLITSQWLLTTFDRSLLNFYQGSSAAGVYALTYGIVNIISSFGGLVSAIFYPYIAKASNLKHNAECDQLLNAALKYTLLIVIPGIVGVYVLREQIVTLIGGAKFSEGIGLVKYLLWFPLFSSLILVLQMSVLVQGSSKSVSLSYVYAFVVNFFLNYILIQKYGIVGASIATSLTYGLLAIRLLFLSRKLFYWNWGFLKIGRMIVAAVVMGFFVSWFDPTNVFTKLLTILFGGLVYCFLIVILKIFGSEEITILKHLFLSKVSKRIGQ